MHLTKFSLATLLAACAFAAATPGSHKSGAPSDSDSCSSNSDSDSCSSNSDSDSSCSDSDSDGGSCRGDKHHPAPWHHGSHPQYWQHGPHPQYSGEWNHGQYAHHGKHQYFDGVYVYVDGLFKKRSALITFVQPTGIPVSKFVRKGCTAVSVKVNQVVVAPLNSASKVKTTFYSSLEDCEKGHNAVKKIGYHVNADLGGKKIGAVHIWVPKKHRKSHKPKKHHHHDHKEEHHHHGKEEHHHGKGKGKKHD